MGYIVDLTVILDEISGTPGGNVTENAALKVMGTHLRSGRRDSIHQDICRKLITENTYSRLGLPPRKKIRSLERTIGFISNYCAPSNS